MGIYEELGVRPIINARSYSTKVGGAPLPAEVLDAMREAAEQCVRMDELQEAAGRAIAEATGAETGIVTSGASAALTLAAAACLAGSDVSRMNRLPDTAGMPCEIVVHRSHRNDYDHALRAAGARFVEAGFSYFTFPTKSKRPLAENTAALFYQAGGEGSVLPLEEFVQIAHRHGKPVIVDAAADLPPRGNFARISRPEPIWLLSAGASIFGDRSLREFCAGVPI